VVKQVESKNKRSRDEIMADIMQAAIVEFSENGFPATSTQAIAERAGLSKAQLHYYIVGKDQLYEEVLKQVIEDWIKVFSLSDVDLGPRAVLTDYIRKKLLFSFEQPLLSRIYAREVMQGATVLTPLLTRSRQRNTQAVACIEKWMGDGLMRRLDPLLLMMHIWSVTQHFADFDAQVRYMMRLKDGEQLDREHVITELTEFILIGCGIPPLAAD